jgi:hypothetical protein
MSNDAIKQPLITTTWKLTDTQMNAALESYLGVRPFATANLSLHRATHTSDWDVTLTEDSDSHARRIAAELRKEDRNVRQIQWNDVRGEVLDLLKAARGQDDAFDPAKWKEDASRIIQLFG